MPDPVAGEQTQTPPVATEQQQTPPPTTENPAGPNGGEGEEKRFTQSELNAQIDARLKREREAAATKAAKDAEAAEAKRLQEQGEWQKVAETNAAKVAELEAAIAHRDHEALKAKVAAANNLPPAMAARLVGTTEDELTADAKELAKVVTAQTPPPPGNGPSPRPSGGAAGDQQAKDRVIATMRSRF